MTASAPRIELPNLRTGYVDLVRFVREHGTLVAPRGMPTVEVEHATVVVDDPCDVLPVGVGRGTNLGIAAYEAAALVAGASYPDLITRIAPNFKQFMNDGGFYGAYGPRVQAQIPAVVARLSADRDSRQAGLAIWESRDVGTDGMRDYPCTLNLWFTVRHDALNMHVTMRSNDVWWGIAYDAFMFTQLQITLARVLQLDVGRYYHTAYSLHAYARDFDAMDKLRTYDAETSKLLDYPLGFGHSKSTVEEVQTRADAALRGELSIAATPSEQWYVRKLA